MSEMKKSSVAVEVGKDVVKEDVANAVKEDMTGSFASDAKDKIDDELK